MRKEEETVLYDPKITYEKQESGQILMLVKFANGETWFPKWREVCKIFDKALLIEKINKKRFGKGRPKTLLVNPTIKIMKSHGYLKESLFRFDMTAEVHETDITLSKRIFIISEDFEGAREKAIGIFEESLIGKTRDLPTFANKLMELKKIVVTEYLRKKKWKEKVKEEYF